MTEVSLGYYPREWQRECHVSRKRFTVLALHRRGGKTELAIMELVDKALRFRWITVGVVVGMFIVALFGFGYVKQAFFPELLSVRTAI